MTATGSTAFVVEIQALQKLLAEKDAEIERIRTEIAALVSEEDSMNYEFGKLKALLTRAADALENLEVGSFVYGRPLGLIAELRKAVE